MSLPSSSSHSSRDKGTRRQHSVGCSRRDLVSPKIPHLALRVGRSELIWSNTAHSVPRPQRTSSAAKGGRWEGQATFISPLVFGMVKFTTSVSAARRCWLEKEWCKY